MAGAVAAAEVLAEQVEGVGVEEVVAETAVAARVEVGAHAAARGVRRRRRRGLVDVGGIVDEAAAEAPVEGVLLVERAAGVRRGLVVAGPVGPRLDEDADVVPRVDAGLGLGVRLLLHPGGEDVALGGREGRGGGVRVELAGGGALAELERRGTVGEEDQTAALHPDVVVRGVGGRHRVLRQEEGGGVVRIPAHDPGHGGADAWLADTRRRGDALEGRLAVRRVAARDLLRDDDGAAGPLDAALHRRAEEGQEGVDLALVDGGRRRPPVVRGDAELAGDEDGWDRPRRLPRRRRAALPAGGDRWGRHGVAVTVREVPRRILGIELGTGTVGDALTEGVHLRLGDRPLLMGWDELIEVRQGEVRILGEGVRVGMVRHRRGAGVEASSKGTVTREGLAGSKIARAELGPRTTTVSRKWKEGLDERRQKGFIASPEMHRRRRRRPAPG